MIGTWYFTLQSPGMTTPCVAVPGDAYGLEDAEREALRLLGDKVGREVEASELGDVVFVKGESDG